MICHCYMHRGQQSPDQESHYQPTVAWWMWVLTSDVVSVCVDYCMYLMEDEEIVIYYL